ncbi:hypothetical protein QWY75_02135 [Pontixanthobacter aestiaquae]|uniref:Uncharacterized protein n=2 Tax=Pontixanthobacter aestiaquae TaxID=1509367 RepID=A0A844Z858_9SPHN|nr:DUF6628 family protein [Pontixanthobacter aestiaquae]MDN3645001.1 hypothetical protein [Pontixanthobacter aestiaquae]MXO83998.1 hypothetical protein [Pontixanthobacter aestiaquae]
MLRRMGGHGLRDAKASWIGLNHFGQSFRQPLVLLRCFVAEIAQASQRSIMLANCCAPRMTEDEGLMLETLALCGRNPERAKRNLARLTDGGSTIRPFSVARALNIALENMGRPLEG